MGSQDWQSVCKGEMAGVILQYKNNIFQWAIDYANEVGF